MLAPGGMVTRTFAPPPHAAASASSASATKGAARATRRLGSTLRERMLEENGRGECIDVFLAAARRAAHLANRAERHGCRVALVDQLDGQAGALGKLGGHGACFGRARRLVAVAVERQTHHEAARLERRGAPHQLGDRRTFAGAPHDRAGGRCDRAGWIADRQPDAALAVVDRQQPPAVRAHEDRRRAAGYPWTICWKNSLLCLDRDICLMRNSVASTSGMSERKLRSRYTRLSSSCVNSSSSLQVPERLMSIAGNTRRSAILRSSTSSMLHLPLNSSKITSSMREPVSISAVAMIVSEPPPSMLRAAPKKRFGFSRPLASTPPERIFPDCGATALCVRARRVIESSRMTTSFLCSTRRRAFSITISATCTWRVASSSKVEAITSASTLAIVSVTSSGRSSISRMMSVTSG